MNAHPPQELEVPDVVCKLMLHSHPVPGTEARNERLKSFGSYLQTCSHLVTLQWLWPSPLEKLRTTDGMHSLEWKPFTKQEVYTISTNVSPWVLTEVYHQPWDEPATYRYLTMSRAWSDSSNAWEITGFLFGMQHDLRFQEIPGLYTVYVHITQKKETETSHQHSNEYPILHNG